MDPEELDNDSASDEEPEVPQEEKDAQLFEAAKNGEMKLVTQALADGADPKHVGNDGWTPLLWAACNGHADVVSTLIGSPHLAAEPYVSIGGGSAASYGQASAIARGITKPVNSPLHWAAFKGHLHVVWSLVKAGLSPYDLDACGNTSLHLAATGGSVPVLKCLMSEGFDLSQRNLYGNTALELADKPGARRLLKQAASETACFSTGKKFSGTVWRYYCTHSGHFYTESETVRDQVLVKAGSQELRPVRYYKGSLQLIKQLEQRLQEACKGPLGREHLESLRSAVTDARENGCNVLLVDKGDRTYARLRAECAMRSEVENVLGARPVQQRRDLKLLIKLIAEARNQGVRGEDGIDDAEALVQAGEAEVTLCGVLSLVNSIECAGEANSSEIRRLDAAIDDAVRSESHPPLLADSKALQKRLHAELALGRILSDPQEETVVEPETGEPTEFCRYTMWDGTVFDTSHPGAKLQFLQFRYNALVSALESGNESSAFASILERAAEFETELAVIVKEEEEAEALRLEAEEKARLKAAKKAKKKGKKKK